MGGVGGGGSKKISKGEEKRGKTFYSIIFEGGTEIFMIQK